MPPAMPLADRIEKAWREGGPLNGLLRPLSWLYGALAALRRWAYATGLRRTETLPVPVVVVGNLIVGGAGKTPTVLALLQILQAQGIAAGVISRGYGRADDGVRVLDAASTAALVGDEPLLIHRRSGAPVAVGRDRVAAARALLAAHSGLQLIISDDGLQHLRLPRCLSILVFDDRGLGNGRLLPAGPLRQPAPRLLPAGSLVLYNASRPSTHLAGYLGQRRLAGAVGLADWWRGRAARLEQLEALRGKPLLAAAGMAQPRRFFDMLAECGLDITPLALPDHHDFATLPWPTGTPDVVVTEKDAVKIHPEQPASTRIWVVALDFQPEPAFGEAVLQALRPHLSNTQS